MSFSVHYATGPRQGLIGHPVDDIFLVSAGPDPKSEPAFMIEFTVDERDVGLYMTARALTNLESSFVPNSGLSPYMLVKKGAVKIAETTKPNKLFYDIDTGKGALPIFWKAVNTFGYTRGSGRTDPWSFKSRIFRTPGIGTVMQPKPGASSDSIKTFAGLASQQQEWLEGTGQTSREFERLAAITIIVDGTPWSPKEGLPAEAMLGGVTPETDDPKSPQWELEDPCFENRRRDTCTSKRYTRLSGRPYVNEVGASLVQAIPSPETAGKPLLTPEVSDLVEGKTIDALPENAIQGGTSYRVGGTVTNAISVACAIGEQLLGPAGVAVGAIIMFIDVKGEGSS
ncbi:MAG: hypothetical protein M1833_001069 [Piccolia ochrophora]|nr:MAG: hypothetical protein M1833_001069 [Piccolia ochrophora]